MSKLNIDKTTFSAILAAVLFILGAVLVKSGLGKWLQSAAAYDSDFSWFFLYKTPILLVLTAIGAAAAHFAKPLMKDPFITAEKVILGAVVAIPLFFITGTSGRDTRMIIDNQYHAAVEVELLETKQKFNTAANKHSEVIVPCAQLTFVERYPDGTSDTTRFQPQPGKKYLYNYKLLNYYELEQVQYGSEIMNSLGGGNGNRVLATYRDKIFDFKSDYLFTSPDQISVSESTGSTTRTVLMRYDKDSPRIEGSSESAEDLMEMIRKLQKK